MADRVPLSEAAIRLRLTYQQTRTLLLRGDLSGGRDPFGHFFADATDVERLRREREANAAVGQLNEEVAP